MSFSLVGMHLVAACMEYLKSIKHSPTVALKGDCKKSAASCLVEDSCYLVMWVSELLLITVTKKMLKCTNTSRSTIVFYAFVPRPQYVTIKQDFSNK